MDQEKLNYYKQKLQSLYQVNIKTAHNIKEKLREPLSESIGEIALYDNHPGDIGDTTFEREKDIGLKMLTEDQMKKIEDALKAINEGSYGICEACGKTISQDRLDAIPFTTFCQECKKEYEGLDRNPRPVEEYVIRPSVSEDRKDNNAFDGEDAWQAVARYGTSESPSDIGSIEDYDKIYINSGEPIGTVEEYEKIAAHKEKDGQIYQSFTGSDDEDSPLNWANE